MKFRQPAFLLLILAAPFLLSSCDREPPDTHPGQPVTKRRQAFKQMLRSFEPMGLVVRERKEYDKQEFLDLAQKLQWAANQPWQYFVPDSNYPPTRAKPEVWQQPARFTDARQKFITNVKNLTKAAQAGSLDAVKPAFAKVEQSCQDCHREFRGGKI